MKIKICGLFRDEDIEYVNEAGPDYIGFVFAPSKRQVSAEQAERLRSRLAEAIVPVGVFVNAPAPEVAALYSNGVISIAQLHGNEDEDYITGLKKLCDIPIIKTIEALSLRLCVRSEMKKAGNVDYFLIDSGAGSGKTFDWDLLKEHQFIKPWFLAGGINSDNIEKAMALNPYAIDVYSGAEKDGVKDYKKIVQLTALVKNYGKKGNSK